MKQFLLTLSTLLILSSCGDGIYKFPQADIETEDYPLTIHRYGKTLFGLDTVNFKEELKNIKTEYRFFLDADLDDSSNISQIYHYVTDTQLITVYQKTMEVYPHLNELENTLSRSFGRYQYYFPQQPVPEIYTYISDLYYEMPVWKNDSTLIIALDVYLGSDFGLYNKLGLPIYKVRCMTPENLPVDVMKNIYLTDLAPDVKKNTLLDHMISGGKMLTFLDAMLPGVPDSVKICYTAKKLDWAERNEKNIWAFLIENNLLFSTDYQTQTRLIQDGPFTTGFSNDSPARLGIFTGWQIVNRFLKNNPGVSIQEMVEITDAQYILQKSGYKP